jgi:uncharacterized RmlC-like cupin family protein
MRRGDAPCVTCFTAKIAELDPAVFSPRRSSKIRITQRIDKNNPTRFIRPCIGEHFRLKSYSALMPDLVSNEPLPRPPGLRIVRSGELDSNTPQTPGMTRAEAISYARVGAQKLWAGTVVVHPNAKTGPHHHGELETVIYIVRGRARFRWGESLEFVDEAGPGDFVYVPPFAPHQELNARTDQPVEAVIVRSGQEPIVVNLDIPSPEDSADGQGPDPFHSSAS